MTLPEGWQLLTLRDLGTVISGVTFRGGTETTEILEGDKTMILKANNIQESLDLSEVIFVESSNVNERQLLQTGDQIICMSSGSRNLVGKSVPIKSSLHASVAHSARFTEHLILKTMDLLSISLQVNCILNN